MYVPPTSLERKGVFTSLAPRQHAPEARDINKPTHKILLHSLTVDHFLPTPADQFQFCLRTSKVNQRTVKGIVHRISLIANMREVISLNGTSSTRP